MLPTSWLATAHMSAYAGAACLAPLLPRPAPLPPQVGSFSVRLSPTRSRPSPTRAPSGMFQEAHERLSGSGQLRKLPASGWRAGGGSAEELGVFGVAGAQAPVSRAPTGISQAESSVVGASGLSVTSRGGSQVRFMCAFMCVQACGARVLLACLCVCEGEVVGGAEEIMCQ